MKILLVAILLFCFCGLGRSAEKVQKFQYWDKLDANDKLTFFLGFTNGLAASRVTVLQCKDVTCAGMTPTKRGQVRCVLLSDNLDVSQGIAMVDKYYKEHPEKWGDPIGVAMIEALTVAGGPCGREAPQK